MPAALNQVEDLETKISRMEQETLQLREKVRQLELDKQQLINKLRSRLPLSVFHERAVRYQLVSMVEVSGPQLQTPLSGVVYNMSVTGMKLEIEYQFVIGDELWVDYNFHRLRTRVVWITNSEPLNNKPLWEYGLKLEMVTDETRQELEFEIKKLYLEQDPSKDNSPGSEKQ